MAPSASRSSGSCPFRQATLLALAGLALGLSVNPMRPHPLRLRATWADLAAQHAAEEGIGRCPAAEFLGAVDSNAGVILDARPLKDYRDGHVPGAISLPVSAFDTRLPAVQILFVPGQRILVLGAGPNSGDALQLARLLIARGLEAVEVVTEGVPAWTAAGRAVQPGGSPL